MTKSHADPCREILASLGKENYTFTGEPVRVSAEGYRSLLEDMVREAKRLAGILAIYMDEITFGHSISQIKLLIVYDAETCDEYYLNLDEVIRIIGTRNILDENYISVDAKLLENIVKFDCLLQPQWVMGRKVPVEAPPSSEMRFFNISRVLDLLAAGFLYDFFRWEVERNVRTRDALWTLKRLRRLLDLTKVVLRREQFPRWDAYMDTVFTMCDSWFDLGIERYRMLMDSLREGFCILLELIDELRRYFERARIVNLHVDKNAQSPEALLVSDRHITTFTSDWTPEGALQQMLDYRKSLGQFVTVLPASLSLQLYEYAKGKHPFARYVASCFGADGLSGNMERSYISWERAKVLNHYLEFKNRLGLALEDEIIFDCNIDRDICRDIKVGNTQPQIPRTTKPIFQVT